MLEVPEASGLRWPDGPELLGCKYVKAATIHTHVLNRGPAGVRSPVDGLCHRGPYARPSNGC